MFRIDSTDPAYWRDPHAVIREARLSGSVAHDPSGTPVFLGYGSVDRILRSDAFCNDYDVLLTRHGITDGPLLRWWQRVMLNTNPPVHTRLRSLANRAFTPRAIERTRVRMRELSRWWLGDLDPTGSFDFIDAVAEPLPLLLVCDLIGIPTTDHAQFAGWVAELGLVFSDAPTSDELQRSEQALEHLNEYVKQLVSHLERHPNESLLCALVSLEQDSDRLDHDELVALVVNLMIGALDTSRSALCVGLPLILDHGVRAITAPLIDELLRFEPPIGEMRRTATVDTVMAGVPIAAGTSVVLSVFGANRDPEVFDDADRLVADRAGPPHLSFGRGAHFCLGHALARIELAEAFGELLQQYPDVAVIEQPQWTPFLRVRRYDELRVTLR